MKPGVEFRDIKEEGMGRSVKAVAAQSLGPGVPPTVAHPNILGAVSALAKLMMEDADSECVELLQR